MKNNNFEEYRTDSDNGTEGLNLQEREKLGKKEKVAVATLVVLSLFSICLCFFWIIRAFDYNLTDNVLEVASQDSVPVSATKNCDPSEIPEHRVKDDKGPGVYESMPRVAKPETDFIGLAQPYASYEVRRQSGGGENNGDTITLQVFQDDGSCTVEDYVLRNGHWQLLVARGFNDAEDAESYLVGQNNGPMAAPE